ncbi:hypothetical protein OSB04_025879 [Centaurea solstitialis]|uniref:Uncharacterized protein n=1 Tax=Centaurea solstitialis TaxID=347529 RepID=A0AA38W255_9ASTR|nr:hypothetical protein OSB04_025879 [Centaurea solstitialis]
MISIRCDPLVPYNIGHGKPVTVLHIILSRDTSEDPEGAKETAEDPQPDNSVVNESADAIEDILPDPREDDQDDSNLGVNLSEEPLHLTRT